MDAQTTLPVEMVLEEIERFLAATGMTPTAFGQRALNDPTFVHELRHGRECRSTTRDRVVKFMKSVAA